MNLETNYLGLVLKNPLVPSASPLSRDVSKARELEDAGASALVMYSLFEEEIREEEDRLEDLILGQSIGFGEADSYLPVLDGYKGHSEEYLEHLSRLKDALGIPVIASLNGTTSGGWVEHARFLEQNGADALELNIYHVPVDVMESGEQVEERYLDVLRAVKKEITIPVTLKLGAQFSSPGHFIKRLEAEGAAGVALFNRFYQPDINLESLQIESSLLLSDSYESLVRMHWIAIMCGQTKLSLAATGGIHTVEDIVKLLLAGADVTHLCSVLLRRGVGELAQLLAQLEQWLETHEYESVGQLKGSVCRTHAINPLAFERVNYLKSLAGYSMPS